MRSVASDVNAFLERARPGGGLALRVAANNAAFARAVRLTWSDNPAAARFVLAHVNTLYVKREEGGRDGRPASGDARVRLDVYLDDSLARAELNARREVLLMHAREEGLRADELVMHASVRAMRDRRAFPDPDAAPSAPPPALSTAAAGRPSASRDASEVLEDFKRCLVLCLGSIEDAARVLDEVRAAAVEQAFRPPSRRRKGDGAACWVHLFAPAARVRELRALFAAHGLTLARLCSEAGVALAGVAVHESTPEMESHRAFPRSGNPLVLRNADARRLRALRRANGRPGAEG